MCYMLCAFDIRIYYYYHYVMKCFVYVYTSVLCMSW